MRRIVFIALTVIAVALANLIPTESQAQSAGVKTQIQNPGSKVMLNPQPLPPKDAGLAKRGIIIVSGKSKKGGDVMLNPQPLPPKDTGLAKRGIIIVGGKSKKGGDVMLNPQPLPPKERLVSRKMKRKVAR